MIDFYISLIVALLMALSPLFFAVIIIYFGITSDNIVANVIVPLLGIIILIGSGSLIAYGAKKSNERIERCKAIVSQFDERLEEVDGTIVCYYDGLYCNENPKDSSTFFVQDCHISWNSSCGNCGKKLDKHYLKKLSMEDWVQKQEEYEKQKSDLFEFPPY